ncbi:hypothetical protein FA13DRAFT_1741961 [Coprinellus micaceus]|uniref:Uncharacterized protein n=1 Tax=Coprinellus micaceus TaxID=71717 RepID=A0A4Y7SHQ5_COPMI|nr:hypothetical protein FA13DRAFT_1741961 [Coprinellus micaceus]
MNTITAWISLKTNLPEGDGVYQFFFFGWRTLTKKWRVLFLLWEISNTIESVIMTIAVMYTALTTPGQYDEEATEEKNFKVLRATAIFWGSVVMLVIIWPCILWMELIVKRNNIVSETDMISVYLFVAQVGTMVLPALFGLCF